MTQISNEPSDVVLAHYGVAGMKWGKRSSSGGSSSSKPKEPVSADAANAEKHATRAKTSGTKALSNKELQDVVTRMNLEQQYSKLNSNTKASGQDMVKKILADNAKQLAGQYAKKGIELGIQAAISAAKK